MTAELNETECDKQTCECDKNLTLCLKDHLYRDEYRGYLNVYCQGPTPNCSIYDPYPEQVTCGHGLPATRLNLA